MRARVTSAAPDDLAALRLLCESVYQPTDVRRDAIVAYDWSGLPRVARMVGELQSPVSPAAVSDGARRLLTVAVEELAPSFPPVPGSVTPLEVVRMHVLDLQPWPSLEAQLREEGRPVSRGTLIRRQHDFLPYFREWAAFDPHAATSEAAPHVTTAAPVRGTTRRNRLARILSVAAALVILVSVIAWTALRNGSSGDRTGAAAWMISPEHMGRSLQLQQGMDVLPAPYPPLPLPELEGRRIAASVIERTPGRPRILIAQQIVGEPAPHFGLWDPFTRQMDWESSFLPPPEQRLTHDGVGEEVLDQSYWVSRMYYAGPEGNLGRFAVLGLLQGYSPFFIAFLDLDSGEIVGHYVHPGHLYVGAVYDVDGDGACEIVLGGTDNVAQRPTVVALRPGPGVSAASTVKWNSAGTEGALARVFLPPWPEAATAIVAERLGVHEFDEHMVDFHARIVTVGVGVDGVTVYHARLGPGLRPADTRPLLLWDKDLSMQSQLGLSAPPLEEWVDDIVDVREFARERAQ